MTLACCALAGWGSCSAARDRYPGTANLIPVGIKAAHDHGAARGGWGSQLRRNGTICQRKRYAQDPNQDTEMAECPKATNSKTRTSRNIRKACFGTPLWFARRDPNPQPTRVRSRQPGQHLKYHLGRPSCATPEGLPTKMQGRCPLDVRSPPRWSGLGPGLLGARPPKLQCAPADP